MTDLNEQWRVHHMAMLESRCKSVAADASDIAHHIRCIPGLPTFETNAEEAFDKALIALADATLVLKVARSDLAKKRKADLKLVAKG